MPYRFNYFILLILYYIQIKYKSSSTITHNYRKKIKSNKDQLI